MKSCSEESRRNLLLSEDFHCRLNYFFVDEEPVLQAEAVTAANLIGLCCVLVVSWGFWEVRCFMLFLFHACNYGSACRYKTVKAL
jgi:hypothetical protein